MDFRLSAPSKTFLIGEYGVLNNGPAIVLNTLPRFELIVTNSNENKCHGIHPLSPAGKWLRLKAAYFNKLDMSFEDPWEESGGLGASSAQFIFIHALSQLMDGQFPFLEREKYLDILLNDFLLLHDNMKGTKPSGVDLVSQFLGGITIVTEERKKSLVSEWPFPLKNFLIFKTGNKVNSHEHLQSLKIDDLKSVKELSQKSLFLFEKTQWTAFAESVNHFQGLLQKNSWVADKTTHWVREILGWPEVEAVKGCGAQGADTLLLLCDDSLTEVLKMKCEDLELQFVGDKTQLASGFSLNSENLHPQSVNEIHFLNNKTTLQGDVLL